MPYANRSLPSIANIELFPYRYSLRKKYVVFQMDVDVQSHLKSVNKWHVALNVRPSYQVTSAMCVLSDLTFVITPGTQQVFTSNERLLHTPDTDRHPFLPFRRYKDQTTCRFTFRTLFGLCTISKPRQRQFRLKLLRFFYYDHFRLFGGWPRIEKVDGLKE